MNCIRRQYRIGKDRIFGRLRPHYNTVWLDDMYMGIPALAWYGALKGDTASIGDAVSQIRAFKARMWVSLAPVGGIERGLFRHGWVEEMNPHPFFPWGRANGWAILTMCEVLDAMKAAGYTEGRDEVLDLLRRHVAGLCAVQDKTGMWHQLLNDPSSYLETSATAIFTYCLAHAICEGWIDALAHGYGPVVWAGGEMIRLLNSTHPKMNDSAIHFYPTEQRATEPIFTEKRNHLLIITNSYDEKNYNQGNDACRPADGWRCECCGRRLHHGGA